MIVGVTGCDSELNNFEKKVKVTVNPVELQAWATNLIARERTNGADYIYIHQDDVPKYIGLIYKEDGDPGYVTIERNRPDDSDAFVQILYGGGFGHWGLAIGYPTLVLSNNSSCYSDFWKPGIYFWACQ